MKDNSFQANLQSRLRRLNKKRIYLQQRIEQVSCEFEIIKLLKEIRSLDFERYRLFKQLNGAV